MYTLKADINCVSPAGVAENGVIQQGNDPILPYTYAYEYTPLYNSVQNVHGDGGALYIDGNAVQVTVNAGSALSGNAAKRFGGAAFINGYLRWLAVTDNSSADGNAAIFGGAVFVNGRLDTDVNASQPFSLNVLIRGNSSASYNAAAAGAAIMAWNLKSLSVHNNSSVNMNWASMSGSVFHNYYVNYWGSYGVGGPDSWVRHPIRVSISGNSCMCSNNAGPFRPGYASPPHDVLQPNTVMVDIKSGNSYIGGFVSNA